ncbi:scavenger mRNA decapping enzyme [Basidiobolus meristosporus CBS 931.73]|uniref:m7GpppX diphosphatase n=1 Tax=Basidiobolus meristosporus CBS 931.73 TaxID=1314790 RepID=A0A1Y1XPN3_9FUNG|nr:scavenger mRNA decapping enzyme [Basidiobolus meristosporus CBS 931.73]|eukprot:ORX87625.1 scavenger mRNA decapping enzyme [Basidiobolus meristosporus CBS 931.73]
MEVDQSALLKKLESFRFVRQLNEDSFSKSVALLGKITDETTQKEEQGILLVEKLPFQASEIPDFVSSRLKDPKLFFNNDVYHWYKSNLDNCEAYPDVKMTLIYPATDVHVNKYSEQEAIMVRETPDMYEKVVVPYIKRFPVSRIQWVYNILDKVQESEKIIFEDPDPQHGFILLPDSKWDQTTMKALYLLVICHTRDIHSVRDLRSKHLELLRRIRAEIPRAVVARYPHVTEDQLKLYIHYQPSYYHFHVHVTHVGLSTSPGATSGKAILLDTVIDNIECIDPEYYAKCTISYVLGTNHGLYASIREYEDAKHDN